VYSKTGRATAW